MSLEAHHRFILDTMQRNQDIARNIINELEAENARLKAEVEMLNGRVNYWKIEAECDHRRWLRTLEDLENLRKNDSRIP
jgi:maltooligosyltrehalose synthase